MGIFYAKDIKITTYKERETQRKKYEWYKPNNVENISIRLGEIFYHMDLCVKNQKQFDRKLMYEKNVIYNLFGSNDDFMRKAHEYSDYLWKNNKVGG